jgi:hypothetical protein
LTGSGSITTDPTLIEQLYLGTCSSTAGVECTPHQALANITVTVTLVDTANNTVSLSAQP